MPETAGSTHIDYRISMYQPMAHVAVHKHMIQEQIYHVLEGEGLMEIAGIDADYVRAGKSCFTAETHIRHLDEAQAGDRISVTTRVLKGEGKKLHVWHEMPVGDRLVATGEDMLIHVDLGTRKAAEPSAGVAARIAAIAAAHAGPLPEGAGRAVGQGR